MRDLPVDVLKVPFVDGSARDDRALLGMLVRMGLQVVAEGIERPEQRDLGCELGQGYLLGRPMPPRALAARLASVAGGVAAPAVGAPVLLA